MEALEQMIRASAIARLAKIFHLPVTKLSPDLRFGTDLAASFVSDFRSNELDQVNDDIRDVADRAITKELGTGQFTIRTVGDYCDHMIRCSKVRPKDVKRSLKHA
ncbi:hypothetical protein JWH06_09490 [Xanthomonas melonis]|nr:hypothetical protein [Xanthomonas melonis]MCD0258408.1 hypothetical protein [Xanthomonas melonis]